VLVVGADATVSPRLPEQAKGEQDIQQHFDGLVLKDPTLRPVLDPIRLAALREVLDGYPSLDEVAWLQEEPENMGAWDWVRGQLLETIEDRCSLRFIGRVRSASPSEGSATWHQINQRKLVDEAFAPEILAVAGSTVLSKSVYSLTGSKR